MSGEENNPTLKAVNSAKKPKPINAGGGGSGRDQLKRFGDYQIIGGAFHQIKSVRSGPDGGGLIEIPLCDFICKILEEITTDDGLQDHNFLRIEGTRQDNLTLPIIDVPVNKFYSVQGNWVNDFWGTMAFIYPGSQKKDNLRACVHLFSKLDNDVPRRLIFQYIGWIRVNDAWHYLTGSGAITADGLNPSYEVDLGKGHMARYTLPAPPDKEHIKAAMPLVLDLLKLCPTKQHIGAALLAAVARAPLNECHPADFSLFIHGVTGSKKSAITAIALAFFGEFNARRFPGNFSDTENDLEAKAFQAKDSVFVVDDFKPSVSPAEASRLHAKSERLFRNTGNQAGRGRRGSDMQAKAAPYNRSMMLVTGEDLPKGQSLLGRLLILELLPTDVDVNTLTKLQHAANANQLAEIMAAYLRWLAPRLDDFNKRFPQMVTALRDTALRDGFASSHPRAPEIYANLVAGAEMFLDFLTDSEALTVEQNNALLSDIEGNLKTAFSEQSAYQAEQDEAARFFDLLRASFVSGNAHVECSLKQGPPPSRPHAWGWRSDAVDLAGCKVYKSMGDCIGWYCDQKREIWLQQNAAFAVAQRLAKIQSDAFLLSASSLWRRMNEKGLILATETREKASPRLTVKRTISGGKPKRVMVISADLLESG